MNNKSGFTLIETLIYMVLFAIVIGGGMVATYQIIEATDADHNHVILQEEANFLLRKINWALTGANSFSIISSPPSLSITKTGSPTIIFNENSNNLQITRGTGSPIILNSSNITVTNLSFLPISGGTGITTSFALTTVQNGRPASQTFSTTKYLRK